MDWKPMQTAISGKQGYSLVVPRVGVGYIQSDTLSGEFYWSATPISPDEGFLAFPLSEGFAKTLGEAKANVEETLSLIDEVD